MGDKETQEEIDAQLDASDAKVIGEKDGLDSVGVFGHATLSGEQGETLGVKGQSDADADLTTEPETHPAGVRGMNTGSGVTYGVHGDVSSLNGRGVMGFATSDGYTHSSPAQFGAGVMGVTDRSGSDGDDSYIEAMGVMGWTTADSGRTYGMLGRNENSGRGFGMVGVNTADGGIAVGAFDEAGDANAFLGSGGYGVFSRGAIGIDGEIIFYYGEGQDSVSDTQKTGGPIAKGFVSGTSLENGVNVSGVTWNDSESRYEITIKNEHITMSAYAANVSPADAVAHKVDTKSNDDGNNDLVVKFADDSQHDFQLIVHEIPSGTNTTTTTTQPTRPSRSE